LLLSAIIGLFKAWFLILWGSFLLFLMFYSINELRSRYFILVIFILISSLILILYLTYNDYKRDLDGVIIFSNGLLRYRGKWTYQLTDAMEIAEDGRYIKIISKNGQKICEINKNIIPDLAKFREVLLNIIKENREVHKRKHSNSLRGVEDRQGGAYREKNK